MASERRQTETDPLEESSRLPLPRLPATGRLTKLAKTRAKRAVLKQVPGGARYSFRVDLLAMCLQGAYLGAVFPFVNVIARRELHASELILALMAAAPFFGNLMALFWARAMDGRAKVPFVKWSYILARSSIFLSMFTWAAVPFASVISGAQIIGTVATPAYAAIIKEVYPESQRGRILSITRAAIVLAQVFSTLLVGWLLTVVSYRMIFPVAAVVGIVSAVIFARIHPGEEAALAEAAGESGESKRSTAESLRETAAFVWNTLGILKSDVSYRWFAFSVFTYGFGNLLNTPILPMIQVNELGISEWQISLLTVASQVAMALSFFYWGRFVDLRSPQLAVALNILLTALIPVIYILAGTVFPASPWVLFPAFIVTGIVNAGIDLSYFAALLTFAGETNVSRYQALQSFLLGVRGSIAPFIGAAMARGLQAHGQNLRWEFIASVVLILTGCWMQFVAMRKQERLRGAAVS
ncbi:MAG TPA: MFS transporter [Armatimonadota bacterium]|nr:MFS transporter [Armatimonadota bacterium]